MRYMRFQYSAVALAIYLLTWRAGLIQAQDRSATPRPENGSMSGVIELENGDPAKTRGWLYTDTTWSTGNGTSSEMKTQGRFKDKFAFQIHPGTVWIKYFAEGYAPAWIGPLDVAPGAKLENLKLVLKPGKAALLQIVSEDGKPVPRAKIMSLPFVGDNSNGPVLPLDADDKGECRLEHLADAPYTVRVTAPGYEPRRVVNQPIKIDEPNVITMTPSLIASGVVFTADGKPATGAKICFRHERATNATTNGGSYGMGEVIATTDDEGRFKLDQLVRGSEYLYVVEGADKSRMIVRTVRAGVEGVQIRLPKDQNLQVKLVGDISQLPMRKGRRFISVRQEFKMDVDGGIYADQIGEDAPVTPTDDGGVAEYVGLLSGAAVQITAGPQQATAEVVANGRPDVTIRLDDRATK